MASESSPPQAQQDTRRLDPLLQTRILDKLGWMGQNARFLCHQSLVCETTPTVTLPT